MRVKIRRKFITGVLLPMVCALALSCSPKTDPPVVKTAPPLMPRPWAVLYAFAPEGLELQESMSVAGDTVWAGRPISVGWLVQPLVLAASGVGMANAAATTQYIIDHYNPQGIIFTGICGGVNPAHQIGDIVIPDQWITHDFGYWGPEGFTIDSVPVGRTDTVGFQPMIDIWADTQLVRRLGEAANRISFRFRTVAGRLPEVSVGGAGVSGNTFIDSKLKRDWLSQELNAEIVDMESAAVVQTAHAAGIPVVVVRSCSDLAGGSSTTSAGRQLQDFFDVAAINSALVVKEFLETKPDTI
jgi:adenosylhomocysteine nucleosidase